MSYLHNQDKSGNLQRKSVKATSFDDNAPGTDGQKMLHVARATYDFSSDGGLQGAIGLGVFLPDNAVVKRCYYDVETAFTSGGAATVSLDSEGTGDLKADEAIATGYSSGQHDGDPDGTAANMVKMTAKNEVTMTISTADLTAGKAHFYVEYVHSS